MLSKKLHAFTIAELLVTLALTAILIVLSYSGLNYIQKLLKQYNTHSFFITQMAELDKRLDYQVRLADKISSNVVNRVVFESDSGLCELAFYPDYILLNNNNQADSFFLSCTVPALSYEPAWGPLHGIINKIEFDIVFNKSTFHSAYYKHYDAFNRLKSDLENDGN